MLILVRHGRTAANASGLLLGHRDPGLDAMGMQQAGALAVELHSVARVITSPLARARETGAAIAAAGDLVAEVDPLWIELDYGVLDGTPLSEVPLDLWQRWQADVHFAPQGGESLATLGTRVRDACADLMAEAADRDVVVVSHVSPIKAAVAWALGVGDEVAWRMFLEPASISRVALRTGRPSLVAFNDIAHLAAIAERS